MWSAPVLIKYWSLQLAGWVVVLVVAWIAAELFGWPKKAVWIIAGAWAAKDVLLYPLVWRAYEQRDSDASAYPAAGTPGVVLRRLDPKGAVRIRGERWSAVAAEGAAPVEPGERVRVVGREGMTLIVEPTGHAADEGSRAAHSRIGRHGEDE